MPPECVYHPERVAVELCAECKQPICKEDVVYVFVNTPGFCRKVPVCKECYEKQYASA